jgi:hypothetical protein
MAGSTILGLNAATGTYFGANTADTAYPPLKGTQAPQLEKAFKKVLRDKSILSLITNRKYQGKFKGVGTEIDIPLMPEITINSAKYGDAMTYQTPQSGVEKFSINREYTCGLHFMEEDTKFAQFDVTSPIIAEAAQKMGEKIEQDFFNDILDKCHAKNKGANAGFESGGYNLGIATEGVALDKSTIVDFILGGINALREQPGGKTGSYRVVVPTLVGHYLQGSDLKRADWMGDAQSVLRKDVQLLGNLSGADIIVSDKVPKSGDTYPILFVDTEAITFFEEVRISEKLKDKDEWGDFYRTKVICDWYALWPEKFGVGYLKKKAA